MNFESFLSIYFTYISPVLDVAILTFVFYKAYQLVIRTNSVQILNSAIIVAMAWGIIKILHLSMLQWLLDMILPALIVGFAIVFQPEIRKVLLKLGEAGWLTRHKTQYTIECIEAVLYAAETLSKLKRGMLVVFLRNTKLDDIIDTGEKLDAASYKGVNAYVSGSLLITIFQYDTPLHDGAVVIQDNRLIAAGCFLTLSTNYDIKKTFGTRHRAALGVSEQSDSISLVVSEESGAISLAYDARLHYDLTHDQLKNTLLKLLSVADYPVDENEVPNELKSVS